MHKAKTYIFSQIRQYQSIGGNMHNIIFFHIITTYDEPKRIIKALLLSTVTYKSLF